MMFSYHQVKERPKLLLAMTGLNHAEFAQLLPHFQSALDQYVQHNYIDRDNRQRQYGGGQPELGCLKATSRAEFSCPGFGPHEHFTTQYLGQLMGFSA